MTQINLILPRGDEVGEKGVTACATRAESPWKHRAAGPDFCPWLAGRPADHLLQCLPGGSFFPLASASWAVTSCSASLEGNSSHSPLPAVQPPPAVPTCRCLQGQPGRGAGPKNVGNQCSSVDSVPGEGGRWGRPHIYPPPSATRAAGNAASADGCFACLAVLLEDGQAEGTAAELARDITHSREGRFPQLVALVRQRIRTSPMGHPG